ncbi:advanced glycosylation end product-specific receptor [Entelurus aequoreus]|uniref:advanced glycosylation end product-specific receptor n=1 Tax=Entelurus aequoreus TaxID=161455 RepID=UPI002B1E4983|nr:advanced glycosylation end product-specific receptor [Entelurus aequoreus]XP_061882973.1 advanced glycosylation end product-specific receptor [Entelurus aequoreus]XP_061882974.1 advanced glycosylation end product-specific receptor [Entelurus aequoreus]
MASASILLWLLIAICVSGQTTTINAFVKLECKTDNVGKYGHQSMLNCGIITSKEAKDATVKMVIWKKDGVLLLGFTEPSYNKTPRFSFTESWKKNMNVSLLIANTSVADKGVYTCEVLTDRSGGSTSTNLYVAARYSQPTILSTPVDVSPKSQVTLTCSSEGGYPMGRLGWLFGPTRKEIRSNETEANVTQNGLFHLSSKLNVPPEENASDYTCVVFNATGGEDGNATLLSPKKSPSLGKPKQSTDLVTKIMAPLVVLGALIVGLLLWKRISKGCFQGFRRYRKTEDAEPGNPEEQVTFGSQCEENS